MAFEVSKKQLREQPGFTIAFSYCALQNLLGGFRRDAYVASRSYGWQCDFYGNVLSTNMNIVTGYAPNNCGELELPADLRAKFIDLEKRSYGMNPDDARAELEALLKDTFSHFVK